MPLITITFDGELVDGGAVVDNTITIEEVLLSMGKDLATDGSSLALIFEGDELNPKMTLAECGVGDGANIIVKDDLRTFSDIPSEPYNRSRALGLGPSAEESQLSRPLVLRDSQVTINVGGSKTQEFENKKEEESAFLLDEEEEEEDDDDENERTRQISRMRSYPARFTDFFYRWPRLGLFREVFFTFLLKIVMYLDIITLLICASYMRHVYPWISGVMILLVCAPFIATWSSGLILCERFKLQLKYTNGPLELLGKLLPLFYLFLPSGIAIIVLADVLQWLSEMGAVLGRWLCGRVKEEKVANTSWVQAFPRQRRSFHVLCQSLPEIPLLIYILASKSSVNIEGRENDMIWVHSLVLGILNLLINLFNWMRISLNWDIGVIDYLLPTLRLFGGIIPGLQKIRKGVSTLDWTNFALGQFTYIQFVELVSGKNVNLSSINISYKTLMYLSPNLCKHFGETLRAKDIIANFYAAPSAEQCFREMDYSRRGYISLKRLKKKLSSTGKFKDVDKDKFGIFFKALDEFKRVHYSQFLDSTKSRAYRQLLHIESPKTERGDHCLYKFLVGYGKIESVDEVDLDQIELETADMVDKQDSNLLKLLDQGAEMEVEDWHNIGLRLSEAIHTQNNERVEWLLKLAGKCKNDATHPFVVSDDIGNFPIHYAIMTCSHITLQNILNNYRQSSAMLNKVNNEGISALSLGLSSDKTEIRNIVDKFLL